MDRRRQSESRPNLSEVNVVVVDDSTASSGRLLHLHALSIDSASLPNANEQVFIHIFSLLSLCTYKHGFLAPHFLLKQLQKNICLYLQSMFINMGLILFCFSHELYVWCMCNGCARFFNMFTYLEFFFFFLNTFKKAMELYF